MIKNKIFVYVGGCMISVLIDFGVFVIIINKEFFKKIYYVSYQLFFLVFQLVKGVSGKLFLVLG